MQFFRFQPEIPFSGKSGQKNQINGSVHFICFRLEIPFSNKLGPKIQNYQFKLKLETSANLNIQNLMALFSFSILDRNHPFRTNLVQKMKVVSLS